MLILPLTLGKDCQGNGWREVLRVHYNRWLEWIFQEMKEKRIIGQYGLSVSFTQTKWVYVVRGWPLSRCEWNILYLYTHPYGYWESYKSEQEWDSYQNPSTRSKAYTGALCENKKYTAHHCHHDPTVFILTLYWPPGLGNFTWISHLLVLTTLKV